MSSKFNRLNLYAAPLEPKNSKETKFQKYLRERNQKLLEKCFNIKPITSAPLVAVDDNKTTKETHTEPVVLVEASKEIQKETETKPEPLAIVVRQEKPASCQQKLSQAKSNEFMGDFSRKTKSKKSKTMAVQTLETKRKSLLSKDTAGDKTKPSHKKPLNSLPPQRRASADNVEMRNSSHVLSLSVTRSVKVNKTKSTVWRSFASFSTTSSKCSSSKYRQKCSPFDYDLSREEQKFTCRFQTPMKPPAEAELQLLKKGQRVEYLTQRYEHSPVAKYNYPEATSWRIGWFHNQPHTAIPAQAGDGKELK